MIWRMLKFQMNKPTKNGMEKIYQHKIKQKAKRTDKLQVTTG